MEGDCPAAAASLKEELERAEIGDFGIRVLGGEEEARVLRRLDGLKISVRVFDVEEDISPFSVLLEN